MTEVKTPPKLHDAWWCIQVTRASAYRKCGLPYEPRDLNAEEMRDLEAVLDAEDLEAEADALEAEDERRS
ncbi:MAG TPA: hypothetical protein VGR73_20515 [Bryobacteraceae bacterium]|nr:hypothetical protein [Bryobacteraceae bacterium]